MVSVETVVREALRTWVAARPWSVVPTVTAQAPEPGDKPALPTLACWFDRTEISNAHPRELAPGVFDTGQAEAAVTFLFRCSSEVQADTFRREWRDLVWTAAMDASVTGLAPALPLCLEFDRRCALGKLYLDGPLELAAFDDTQTRSLWLLRAFGRLAYPALAFREPTALMGCTLRVNGTPYPVRDFQAPRLLATAPPMGQTLALTEPIGLLFDQPMAPFHLAGVHVERAPDGLTFALLPHDGWRPGPNTLVLPATLRSAKGRCLGEALTLHILGVSP